MIVLARPAHFIDDIVVSVLGCVYAHVDVAVYACSTRVEDKAGCGSEFVSHSSQRLLTQALSICLDVPANGLELRLPPSTVRWYSGASCRESPSSNCESPAGGA